MADDVIVVDITQEEEDNDDDDCNIHGPQWHSLFHSIPLNGVCTKWRLMKARSAGTRQARKTPALRAIMAVGSGRCQGSI